MNRLVAEIEADIVAAGLIADGQTVLVAVSGGVDSVVLLEILHRLAPRHRWNLVVAHFNHQLRGHHSAGDERFVRSLAKRFGLRFVVDREPIAKRARRLRVSVEMAAREARHTFLAAAAHKNSASCVALAHHADDQVELFLLRLLRGAGAEGLGGMKWKNPSPMDSRVLLVRPLLQRRKELLLQFAQDWSLKFRPDHTNDTGEILRNRIRNELIPLLRSQYQPGLIELVLRQSELCVAEAEFVGEAAQRWMTARQPTFSSLATAVQRRVILEQLLLLGIEPEFEKIEALRRSPDRPVQSRNGVVLTRSVTGMVSRATTEPGHTADAAVEPVCVKLLGDAGTIAAGRYRIEWMIRSGKVPSRRKQPGQEWFDADTVGDVVRLRTREAGDRFQPCGMAGSCKLQDLLTNAGVPRERRSTLLMAVDKNGVIWWVDGLRIAETHKIGVQTRRFLRWRWSVIK